MELQDKIKYIRSACIEANPSMLDLVFGCEFEKAGTIYKLCRYNPYSPDGWKLVAVNEQHKITMDALILPDDFRKELKIIGRPIRLADILYLHKRKIVGNNADFRCEITLRWNLLQDDLLLQEESVIDFIYSLLKKETI